MTVVTAPPRYLMKAVRCSSSSIYQQVTSCSSDRRAMLLFLPLQADVVDRIGLENGGSIGILTFEGSRTTLA